MNYWRLTLAHEEHSTTGQGGSYRLRNLNVADLLSLPNKPGIHLVFMPALQPKEPQYNEDLSNGLMKEFCLPSFFFENMGWDANGFFGSVEIPFHTHSDRGHRGFATFSRFLSKQIVGRDHGTNKSKYTWQYMGISTLWLKHSDIGHESALEPGISLSSNETHIMLYFNLDPIMIEKLIIAFDRTDMFCSRNEPFFQLKVALGTVVQRFEKDLNTFQPAVRKIEQERYVDSKADGSEMSPELVKERRDQDVKRYVTLHEVSRHVLHIAETLGAATNNLTSIIQEHELWMRALQPSLNPPPNNTARTLRLYLNIFSNLKLRADAFVARMENEIKCASNLLGVVNNNISLQTLNMTREELRHLQFEVGSMRTGMTR